MRKNIIASWLLACYLIGAGLSSALAAEWIYTVRPGDNLESLAEKFLINRKYTSEVVELNGLDASAALTPGTRLKFPLHRLKFTLIPVKVITLNGTASLQRYQSDIAVPLKQGDWLHTGDSVTTDAGTDAVIEFGDGSTMQIRENTAIVMDSLSVFSDTGMVDTRVRLQRGRTATDVEPQRVPGSRFEIETPAALSAVRGTKFRAGYTVADESARTEVIEGAVGVSNQQSSRRIEQHYGLVAKIGSKLGAPKKLLPEPDLSTLPTKIEYLPTQLNWPPVDQASAYRLQLAADASFQSLLIDRINNAPSMNNISVEENGDYFLRVRGIDHNGLEGLDATANVQVFAYPEPPFTLTPKDKESLKENRPMFSWTEVAKASRYHFQLAASQGFEAPLIDHQTADSNLTPEQNLEPGSYFWRVSSFDKQGETGPPGHISELTILAPGPAIGEVKTEDGIVTLKWHTQSPDTKYIIQVAKNDHFDSLVVDETVSGSSYSTPKLSGGDYFVRTAIIDTDGNTGAFSDAQSFAVPHPKWPGMLLGILGAILIL